MKKVLIVDDSSYYRERAAGFLEEQGYSCFFAENGLEAYEMYGKVEPDFVTMDICMPYMDGLEATKKICSKYPNAKVVMCSSVGHLPMYKRQAFKNGAKSVLSKNFDRAELELIIEELKFL